MKYPRSMALKGIRTHAPKRFALSTCLWLSALFVAQACLNTSYSRDDEAYLTSDITRLIMGHFPEHSKAFYESEKHRTNGSLSEFPGDIESLNDRAAAKIKLGQFDDALEDLEEIEEALPDQYRTASNFGVAYKKMGRYEEAAEMIERALEIKPGGHMGLGDYYLRMLDWRAEQEKDPGMPETNFLGIPLDATPAEVAKHPVVDKEHLKTLIKNDRHFPDTYAVLGDVLTAEGDLQNALRAYKQALRMSASNDTMRVSYEERMYKTWETIVDVELAHGEVQDDDSFLYLDSEFASADVWLEAFKQREQEMIEREEYVSFSKVQESLDMPEPRFGMVGVYKGSRDTHSPSQTPLIIGTLFSLGIFLLIVAAGIFIVFRIIRRLLGTA